MTLKEAKPKKNLTTGVPGIFAKKVCLLNPPFYILRYCVENIKGGGALEPKRKGT